MARLCLSNWKANASVWSYPGPSSAPPSSEKMSESLCLAQEPLPGGMSDPAPFPLGQVQVRQPGQRQRQLHR